MKHCIDCGKELATSLEEFGEIGKEKSQSCFLEEQWKQPENEIETLQDEISDLDEKIDELDEQIEELEDECRPLEIDRARKQKRLDELVRLTTNEEVARLVQGEILA
jgi:septal ring factor EnvC (AmiA/AmiB activator)